MTADELQRRLIPFDSLQASTEAFIDYALPECQPKLNYALIGPGVSQNPLQPVSLREPHGFQLGGVTLPHGRVNPPHLHFSCEVFICVAGRWRIQWGFNPETLHVDIGPGDIVSVPTWIYRGFTSIGGDEGFLFTALGRDYTGGILWAPGTVARAAAEGVLLTDNHRIVDTRRGDALQPGERLFQPMTEAEIAALRHWTPTDMARRLVRFDNLAWTTQGLLDSALPGGGAQLAPVVGLGLLQQREHLAPVMHSHGVSLEWLRIPAGGRVSRHRVKEKQALVAWCGQLEVRLDADDGPCTLAVTGRAAGWDSLSIPADVWRSLNNTGDGDAIALLLTAGDHRKDIEWAPDVAAAAAAAGWVVDADGCVAPRRFVERAQP